jgi:hypothetical protein
MTWQLPTWATHPECVALAAVFASPHLAEVAVPAADRRHRLFISTYRPGSASTMTASFGP